MTRTEEIIIKGFLIGAHKAVEDARNQDDIKLAYVEGAYDAICRLAEQLKIENPYKK
jgi:hypothetical protein